LSVAAQFTFVVDPRLDSGEADDTGHHPAGVFGIPPVGVKTIVVAVGAEAAIVNLVVRDTRFDQNAPVGLNEIDLAATFFVAPFREQRRQLLDHFGTYLITTTADSGPNGYMQSRRPDAELISELLHCVLGNGADGAAPPGMDGSDGMCFGVGQQQRHAVRGANAYALTDLITDECIAFTLAIGQAFGVEDQAGVDLAQRDRRMCLCPASGLAGGKRVVEPIEPEESLALDGARVADSGWLRGRGGGRRALAVWHRQWIHRLN
jgi:hypothetical protein